MKKPVFYFFAAACFLLRIPDAGAFGQNKVIVHEFRWKVISTAHFDIHYTLESEPVIGRVAHYLEEAHDRVTKDMGIEIKERTPFFFFPTHNQFEENNIVPVGEGTGGVTEAFKNRFLIFHDGTEKWLQHVIIHEFGHVAEFEVLYGGFWRSARLLKSPLYPLWLMEGYAEYVTGDMDRKEEDLHLRDAATSGGLYSLRELHGFNHLKPHEVVKAYKQGAAAVRFLAREYGRENVAEIFKAMRDRFEPFSVIQEITGQDFQSFERRYLEYMQDYYAFQSEGLQEPDVYGKRLTRPDILPVYNSNPTISPDGKKIAGLRDQGVVVWNLEEGSRELVAGGVANLQSDLIENVHGDRVNEGRAMSFSPDGRWLAFAGEKKQRDHLYLLDTKNNRLRRVKTPFEQIRSPVFSPAGDRLAVVGMKNATNDIYEITPRGRLIRRLTHSPADENHPVYSPDGSLMAYSQEVLGLHDGHPQRDLMGLNLATLAAAPLTTLPGEETFPVFTPDGASLIFVGSPDNIDNLYRLDLAAGTVIRLTQVISGVSAPDMARDGSYLLFSSLRGGSKHIYRAEPALWTAPASSSTFVSAMEPSGQTWPALVQGQVGVPAGVAAATPAFGVADEPLFATGRRPYRFRASTDIFFPLFYYSSTDGLFLAALWQASEYLGNHQLGTSIQYASGERFIDYEVQYTYARFRPQFVLGAGGKSYYQDFSKTELRRETDLFTGVIYPLDRFNRVETVFSSVYRADEYRKFRGLNTEERENAASVSWLHDTSGGRYLAVTSGTRFRATTKVARPVLGGDRDYSSYILELHRFRPTGRERTLALRGVTGISLGKSPELFRLGGADRVRGYSRNDLQYSTSRYVMANLEWRVPMKYLKSYTWFIFPDFFFKAVYGVLFTDAALGWNSRAQFHDLGAEDSMNSVGAGLRVPTFVLQTFPVTFLVDVAKRTDRNTWVVYFGLGPEF